MMTWVAIGGWPQTCPAQKLEDVRDDVRHGKDRDDNDDDETEDDSPRPVHHTWIPESSYHDDGQPKTFRDLGETAVLFTTTLPWWLPHYATADRFGHPVGFPSAPYVDGHPGYLVLDPLKALDARSWSARLSAEYGTDFSDLTRIGTRLRFDTASRIGIDAEWNQWLETVPSGDDRLSTGDFNLVFRFAQHERVQFHSGIGFNWLADADRADFGINVTYGADVFPVDPVVLSTTMDVGSLGDAFFFHIRSTAGVMIGPAELFTGFDYQRIGNVNLQGLTAGLSFWF